TLALAAATRTRSGTLDWPTISSGNLAEDRSYNKTELTTEWNYEPDANHTTSVGATLAKTSAEYSYTRQLTLNPAIAAAFGRSTPDDLAGAGAPHAWTFSSYASMRRRWPDLETEL